jgi:glutathione synthase/RimK-type ligase-like ATP-grasp enzyme
MQTILPDVIDGALNVSPIRGALLSQGPSESNDILIEFFKYRNVRVDCFHILEDILVPERLEIICPRVGQSFAIDSYTFCYGRTWGDSLARDRLHAWQRTLARLNVSPLDPLAGVQNNDDKLRMTEVLRQAEIPVPQTTIISAGVSLSEAILRIRCHFKGQIVVKANGSGGAHVHFTSTVRNADDLVAIIQRYCTNGILAEPLVIQQYIPSKDDKQCSYHYRALLVAGELYAVMRFTAGDKQTLASNIAIGGSAEIVPVSRFSADDRSILRRAAGAMEINIAGVDFLKAPESPLLVLEVNNSPGLNTAYTLGITEHLDAIVGFAILTSTSRNAKYRSSENTFDPCWKCNR